MRKILLGVILLLATVGIEAREVIVPGVPDNATKEECDSMERYLKPCVDYILKRKPSVEDQTYRRVSAFNLKWLSCTDKIVCEMNDKFISGDGISFVAFMASVTKAYLKNPGADKVRLHQEGMKLMLKYYKKNKKVMPQEPYQELLKMQKSKTLDAFIEQTLNGEANQ